MDKNITYPTIFLVDDQKIANFIAMKLLSNIGLNNIIAFNDPIIAFKSLTENYPGIILLDLNMPELNGWQFLQKMQDQNIDTKVIILTSSTSILDKKRAKQFKNVTDYYIKPLNKQKVIKFKETFLNL